MIYRALILTNTILASRTVRIVANNLTDANRIANAHCTTNEYVYCTNIDYDKRMPQCPQESRYTNSVTTHLS